MYAHAHPPVQVSRPASPNSVSASPLARRPSAVDVGLNFDTPMPSSSQQTYEIAQTSAQTSIEIAQIEAKFVAVDNTVLSPPS